MTRGEMYRCMAIASIPADEFERLLAEAKREGKRLTSARIVEIGRTYQRGHDARPRLRPTKAALSELREMLVLAVDTGDGALVEAAINLIDRMNP